MNCLHPVANYMYPYFHHYLIGARGLSTNTILAYRDALKLLLTFAAEHLHKPVDQLKIEDLDDKTVLAFLDDIETERGGSIRTRNTRLAGIRTFFRYVGQEEPVLLQQCRKVRQIPTKRFEHKTIDYLNNDEIQALFDSVDTQSRTGLRDRALFLLLYNTGARVQEVVDLTVSDLRLEPLGQVKLLGKGKKQRACPLWPETVDALRDYLKDRSPEVAGNEYVLLNANGNPITRFGVRNIIKRYAEKAAVLCPSLKNKSVSPHTFRHSTAMHLLRAGNDINMVKLWLGHADINTTHIYVEIDMEMKRKILNTGHPPAADEKKKSLKKWQKPAILKWLDQLSKGTTKHPNTIYPAG